MALLLTTGTSLAAGGHHAVDDAAIMEPGQCKVEGWASRADDDGQLLHAGTGCRVGPVELILAAERQRQDGLGATSYGVQAKWARPVLPALAIGLSVAPVWASSEQPRYQGTSVSGLLTWKAKDTVAVHLNLGRDFLHGTSDQDRYGAAAEWTPHADWSFVIERFFAEQTHFARAGARWFPSENWTLELSRAQRLHGANASNWTLGLSRVFGR
jgi:hypothetical protein